MTQGTWQLNSIINVSVINVSSINVFVINVFVINVSVINVSCINVFVINVSVMNVTHLLSALGSGGFLRYTDADVSHVSERER